MKKKASKAFVQRDAIRQPAVAQLAASEMRQSLVAQILWAHNVLLMQRIKANLEGAGDGE